MAREVERFGGIAHVWSTYEGFKAKDAAVPFVRGINTIQLMQDGARWWILSIGWDAEREVINLSRLATCPGPRRS